MSKQRILSNQGPFQLPNKKEMFSKKYSLSLSAGALLGIASLSTSPFIVRAEEQPETITVQSLQEEIQATFSSEAHTNENEVANASVVRTKEQEIERQQLIKELYTLIAAQYSEINSEELHIEEMSESEIETLMAILIREQDRKTNIESGEDVEKLFQNEVVETVEKTEPIENIEPVEEVTQAEGIEQVEEPLENEDVEPVEEAEPIENIEQIGRAHV